MDRLKKRMDYLKADDARHDIADAIIEIRRLRQQIAAKEMAR